MTPQNKIIVITGANSGIGFATALALAKQGATIVSVCRNADRGTMALKAISAVAAASPRLFIADLSSQASIRELAENLHEQLPRIDVLINNAGAAFAKREYTVDRIEKTFAINHLAPFLLTNLVLGLLRQSSEARIVNVVTGVSIASNEFLGQPPEREELRPVCRVSIVEGRASAFHVRTGSASRSNEHYRQLCSSGTGQDPIHAESGWVSFCHVQDSSPHYEEPRGRRSHAHFPGRGAGSRQDNWRLLYELQAKEDCRVYI